MSYPMPWFLASFPNLGKWVSVLGASLIFVASVAPETEDLSGLIRRAE